MTPAGVAGAVLCGGASRRMGRDKALILLDGRPLALRVADALRAAGADPVVAVGGDAPALEAWGLATVPDDRRGEGPLAAVATALAAATGVGGGAEVVVVAPCDLVAPDPAAFARLATALAGDRGDAGRADVAVPRLGGRPQWATAAWRRSAGPALVAVLGGGERALGRGIRAAGLAVVFVDGIAPAGLADADTPDALPGDR